MIHFCPYFRKKMIHFCPYFRKIRVIIYKLSQ